MLANAKAVLLPVWDPITGYPAEIQVSALEEALRRYPAAKALFLTRPNYYGQAADLAEIISIVHRAGIRCWWMMPMVRTSASMKPYHRQR